MKSVEEELDDVAVLHLVLFAFGTERARGPRPGYASVFDVVVVGDDLGADEPLFEIGVDDAGAKVEYSYAFAFHGGEKAVLVFRFADNALAEKALAAAGFTTLNEREIGESAK